MICNDEFKAALAPTVWIGSPESPVTVDRRRVPALRAEQRADERGEPLELSAQLTERLRRSA